MDIYKNLQELEIKLKTIRENLKSKKKDRLLKGEFTTS